MKRLQLILILLLLLGCDSPQIPEIKFYESVLGKPVGLDYVCHNRAREYWEHLVARNYEAYWVIGRLNGVGHSWVEYVNYEGDTVLIDPTVKTIPSGYERGW